eukprot:4061645-Alexandrium_andersonii.AAC.1
MRRCDAARLRGVIRNTAPRITRVESESNYKSLARRALHMSRARAGQVVGWADVQFAVCSDTVAPGAARAQNARGE